MRAGDPGTLWGPAPRGLSQERLWFLAGTESPESGAVTGPRDGASSPSGTLRGSRGPSFQGRGGLGYLDRVCPASGRPAPPSLPTASLPGTPVEERHLAGAGGPSRATLCASLGADRGGDSAARMEAALRRDPRSRRRARAGQQVPIPRRPGGDRFRPRCSGPVAATRQPGGLRGPVHSASGRSYASVTVETQLSGSHVRHRDVFNPGLAQCACCTACDHGRGTRATSRAMPATGEVRAARPPAKWLPHLVSGSSGPASPYGRARLLCLCAPGPGWGREAVSAVVAKGGGLGPAGENPSLSARSLRRWHRAKRLRTLGIRTRSRWLTVL